MTITSLNKFLSFDGYQPSYLNGESFEHLEKLIAPLALRDFFKKYWKKKAVLIAENKSQKFEEFLRWEHLKDLVVECPENQIKCFDNSSPISGKKADLLEQWHQGTTLHIERIEKLVPPLEELSRQIAKELKVSTKMYAFCSHPNRPGAHLHYDRFDVFVLQIQGTKKWQVQLTEHEKPYLEGVLSPGDLLYMPRGHWHFAVATKEQSLHLTLGISYKNFKDKPLGESILSKSQSKIKNKLVKVKSKIKTFL